MLDNPLSYELFHEFITERNRAVVEGKDSFMFKDKEVLVKYADYMIEYIASQVPEFEIEKSYISLN
jgi:hypothetical protein